MTQTPISVTLVGCGAMGGALLKGWLAAPKLFSEVTIVTPEGHTVDPFLSDNRVRWVENAADLTTLSDVVILGVKPQIMGVVLKEYAGRVSPNTLVITMAAGLDLAFYEQALGAKTQIVRLMPNTPATVSQAMSGLLANDHTSQDNKNLATTILQAVGKVVWVKTDEELDRLTTISGCGPAYVFALVEALENAAKTMGFNDQEATLLARQTVIGSATYLAETPDKTAKDLRTQVTSPGGMTAEGIAVLQNNNRLNTLFEEVAQAAFNRAQELRDHG